MQWPQYLTAKLEVVIDGEPAVIQCWKGLCEDALSKITVPGIGDIEFPGGFGAEVGVYRRIPGHQGPLGLMPAIPTAWPATLQVAAKVWFQARALKIDLSGVTDCWWPADDLVENSGSPVTFTLVDPVLGDALISNYSTNRYWTCQWMRPKSFVAWGVNWHLRHLTVPPGDLLKIADISTYTLNFSVAGVDYVWDATSMRVAP